MDEKAKRNQELGHYLHKTVFLLDKVAEQSLRKNVHIGLSQFLILLAADKQSGLALSQQEIADHLGINKAAISRHVDSLVNRELLIRKASIDNRQSNTIVITDRGIQLLRKAQLVMRTTMTPHYDAASIGGDANTLLNALKAMHDSLTQP